MFAVSPAIGTKTRTRQLGCLRDTRNGIGNERGLPPRSASFCRRWITTSTSGFAAPTPLNWSRRWTHPAKIPGAISGSIRTPFSSKFDSPLLAATQEVTRLHQFLQHQLSRARRSDCGAWAFQKLPQMLADL